MVGGTKIRDWIVSVIDTILDQDMARWVVNRIADLEGRSKYCAHNSIRFLKWADEIFPTSHIVSSFCALHATEEAVAAFISAAKNCGYSDDAKKVNLHDHRAKALVSILVQRLSMLAGQGKLAISVSPSARSLALRIPMNDSYHYGELHLSNFHIRHDQEAEEASPDLVLLGDMPNLDELRHEVESGKEARNLLLYASDRGYPSGFSEPDASLRREAQISLALIWAAIDLKLQPTSDAPFILDVLRRLSSFDGNIPGKGA
jgi:hypothetical protein